MLASNPNVFRTQQVKPFPGQRRGGQGEEGGRLQRAWVAEDSLAGTYL